MIILENGRIFDVDTLIMCMKLVLDGDGKRRVALYGGCVKRCFLEIVWAETVLIGIINTTEDTDLLFVTARMDGVGEAVVLI